MLSCGYFPFTTLFNIPYFIPYLGNAFAYIQYIRIFFVYLVAFFNENYEMLLKAFGNSLVDINSLFHEITCTEYKLVSLVSTGIIYF